MTRRTINRMATGLSGVLTAVAVLAFTSTGADAQTAPACGPRDVVLEQLDARYGEQRRNLMLDARGNLVETFSNDETGSWTLTVTMPGGPTCILSSGGNFVEETRVAEAGEMAS